jgi:hypothetical protein
MVNIHFRFAVHNIPSQSQFTVDIDISVCFEAKTSPCRRNKHYGGTYIPSHNVIPLKGIMLLEMLHEACSNSDVFITL